jgi:RimJ/RimL family protein N-acetyltransferase
VKLIPISEHPDAARILYDLLAERDPIANISHKVMPTWGEHLAFIASDPYEAWYLIGGDCEPVVGACYLTRQNEIGVSLFSWEQGKGYGAQAVRDVMDRHGKRTYLANISPRNEASARMFLNLGFELIQHTYKIEVE